MLGIKEILKDPKKYEERLSTKGDPITLKPLLDAYEALCKAKTDLESEKAKLNAASKQIGEKKQRGESTDAILQEVSELKERVQKHKESIPHLEECYENLIAVLPNLPDESLKVSPDPADNVCIKTVGKKKEFTFPIKNHLELNETHHLFDFTRGAKLSGSGWPVYTAMGAEIEWALINFMIDIHKKNGFTFHLVPHLVHANIMYGSGQLPKFANQAYQVKDKDHNHYMIPTAEVSLAGLYHDEIIDDEDLPKYLVAFSPCYRREAGAAGATERGLIRVHQFNKVELFAYTTPESSEEAFEKLLASAEEVLQTLGLHYRNMLLVTGDTSFAAAKTVDIEVFLPGQDRYMEVSSVSNCRDFQARRSKIRCRKKGDKPRLAHTLNGSGLATPRLLVSLLEHGQQEDGSIILPEALAPYLGKEKTVLTAV